jgi:hypothetical protein
MDIATKTEDQMAEGEWTWDGLPEVESERKPNKVKHKT